MLPIRVILKDQILCPCGLKFVSDSWIITSPTKTSQSKREYGNSLSSAYSVAEQPRSSTQQKKLYGHKRFTTVYTYTQSNVLIRPSKTKTPLELVIEHDAFLKGIGATMCHVWPFLCPRNGSHGLKRGRGNFDIYFSHEAVYMNRAFNRELVRLVLAENGFKWQSYAMKF